MSVRIVGVGKYTFKYGGESFLVAFEGNAWRGYLLYQGKKELMAVRATMSQVIDAMIEDIETINGALEV